MPLLSASQFLDLYDARLVAGRVLDDGSDAALDDLKDDTTKAGRRVAEAIRVATGRLLAAVRVGKRYTREELEAISADDETAGLIRGLIADLAFGNLLKRRALPADDFAALAPGYAEAEVYLEEIRSGNRIFDDVQGVDQAGAPGTVDLPPVTGLHQPLLTDQTRLFGDLVINRQFGPRCN